jgi:hypothetical protein
MNPFKPEEQKEPDRIFSTEPSHASLFSPSNKYREVTTPKKPGYVVCSIPMKGLVRVTKTERLGGYLPGLAPIRADVLNAILELIGVSGSESLLEMRSRADAPDPIQARSMLDEINMELQDGRLRLFSPPNRMNQHCLTEFAITCPRVRPLTVRGVYSAVRISDLIGGADIETTQARITILDVGPQVNARVKEGIVDYAGHQGSVRLSAGWEINPKFTSLEFIGGLDAVSEGPVRVLIPEGFATCFEANVAKDVALVCRADIKSRLVRREEAGRFIYRFGQGATVVGLKSLNGPIVIDNVSGPGE